MTPFYDRDGIQIRFGDCLDVMAEMAANSVDTIITDPPYGLEFMGKDWDHGVPGIPFWQAAIRVAKPGATLLAFGGTRTHHRLMCAIEDAGWEIRDCIMWVYGSGFPKSHNISLALDKQSGAIGDRGKAFRTAGAGDREDIQDANGVAGMLYTDPITENAKLWDGYGTALKPAWEPIIVAMKPRDGTFAQNALKWGVAGLWVDGGRVEAPDGVPQFTHRNEDSVNCYADGRGGSNRTGETDKATGRWPANLIHDGSDEVVGLFPVTKSGGGHVRHAGSNKRPSGWDEKNRTDAYWQANQGSAARFFYCAKASRAERNAGLDGMLERESHKMNGGICIADGRTAAKGKAVMQNHHPTVKPLDLMRYLCRITRTPTGGTVLDPFMGSGSTGVACVYEDRDFVGIEIDADYCEIAGRRIDGALDEPKQPPLFEALE